MLVASLADHSLPDADRKAAEALVASCRDCADLHADIVALRAATPAMPTPARPSDYTLTADDAARLRSRGWRRLVSAFGTARDSFSRPLAVGLTTLGIAGLLVASLPSILGSRRCPHPGRSTRGWPPAARRWNGAGLQWDRGPQGPGTARGALGRDPPRVPRRRVDAVLARHRGVTDGRADPHPRRAISGEPVGSGLADAPGEGSGRALRRRGGAGRRRAEPDRDASERTPASSTLRRPAAGRPVRRLPDGRARPLRHPLDGAPHRRRLTAGPATGSAATLDPCPPNA